MTDLAEAIMEDCDGEVCLALGADFVHGVFSDDNNIPLY